MIWESLKNNKHTGIEREKIQVTPNGAGRIDIKLPYNKKI